MTHLINAIINTSIFPDIFKLSRILPFSKPGKPLNDIDSFRPLNNLPCIEKIVEEYIKICMLDFIEKHNILNNNHHGGRKAHFPLTALAQIITNY